MSHAAAESPPSPPIPQQLSGFAGYPRQRCEVYRAHRFADHAAFVGDLRDRGMIARGAGRAYADSALNEGGAVVVQDRLSRLLDFNAETGEVTCEAGVTLAELIEVFLPRGWFPRVTPGSAHVTVGGAIAADVHGKNHHRAGAFSSCVVWFDLMLADGTSVRCTSAADDDHADLFDATVGGMGLTGVITAARIRLQRVASAYVRSVEERAGDLDALLEAMGRADAWPYSVAWIDCIARGGKLGRGVAIMGDHAGADELPPTLRRDPRRVVSGTRWGMPAAAPPFLLNRLTVGAFNAAYFRRHGRGESLTHYRPFFYPLDGIANWQLAYGKPGFVQYQMVIPDEAGPRPVVDILERIAASGRASFLAVLKRFGPAGRGLLSFPRPGLTLALDLPRPDAALRELTRELDRVTLDHGGRVYLAKDAFLDETTFRAMYGELDRFLDVKRRVDPEAVFRSSQSRRLGIMP